MTGPIATRGEYASALQQGVRSSREVFWHSLDSGMNQASSFAERSSRKRKRSGGLHSPQQVVNQTDISLASRMTSCSFIVASSRSRITTCPSMITVPMLLASAA